MKVKRSLPWRCEYAYIDTEAHLADSLFITRELPVKFRSKEYGCPGTPFVVVFCSFNAKYEKTFLACMADLERKIIMSRIDGYRDACEKAFAGAL